MITVKKRKGKTTGRQTKLTSCAGSSSNSVKVTRPSPYAEAIEPIIPQFNPEGKKKGSGGRGRGAGKKRSQKTLEAFLDSSDEDTPAIKMATMKEALSKPKAQPAAKPAAKSTKVTSSSAVDINLSVNWYTTVAGTVRNISTENSWYAFQMVVSSPDPELETENPARLFFFYLRSWAGETGRGAKDMLHICSSL